MARAPVLQADCDLGNEDMLFGIVIWASSKRRSDWRQPAIRVCVGHFPHPLILVKWMCAKAYIADDFREQMTRDKQSWQGRRKVGL
jgi:hypothetical protein